MRFIIFITLIVCAFGYPRSSCLKSNDICNMTDLSINEYTLCGEVGDLGAYPIDPLALPGQGSGKMRKPEDCDGICVDIMSEGDKDKLECSNAVNLTIQECIQFKNAKHCVADTASILTYVGIGIVVVLTCVCCMLYNPNKSTGTG